MTPEPLDLETIRPWLVDCGPHWTGYGPPDCVCPIGSWRPVMRTLFAECERLRAELAQVRAEHTDLSAAVQRVYALCTGPDPHRVAPPDGSMVLAHYVGGHQDIDEERVWYRNDGAIDREPHPDGDWWKLGEDHKGRHQWGEVLWLDDPACDRGSVSLELLVSTDDIIRALERRTT